MLLLSTVQAILFSYVRIQRVQHSLILNIFAIHLARPNPSLLLELSSVLLPTTYKCHTLFKKKKKSKRHLSKADSGPWHHARLFDYICGQTLNLRGEKKKHIRLDFPASQFLEIMLYLNSSKLPYSSWLTFSCLFIFNFLSFEAASSKDWIGLMSGVDRGVTSVTVSSDSSR